MLALKKHACSYQPRNELIKKKQKKSSKAAWEPLIMNRINNFLWWNFPLKYRVWARHRFKITFTLSFGIQNDNIYTIRGLLVLYFKEYRVYHSSSEFVFCLTHEASVTRSKVVAATSLPVLACYLTGSRTNLQSQASQGDVWRSVLCRNFDLDSASPLLLLCSQII